MSEADFFFEEGKPMSRLYDEGYYGARDGLEESRYVFLGGNGLDSSPIHETTRVIAETGFGTGLNLLALLERRSTWETCPPLHFISVEQHPLSQKEFMSCHREWPELEPWRQVLEDSWPEKGEGWQHSDFPDLDLTLDIFHGPVSGWFENFPVDPVHHWFLDGFSPKQNPEMWTQDLFTQMADRSIPGSTLATFTAAGFIRRGLTESGFVMSKQKGFGNKREMLVGTFPQTS